MRVGIIGMNYKLLDLKRRELFAEQVKKLSASKLECSLVCLSTCNRTEIYFSSTDVAQTHSLIVSELKKEMGEFPDHQLYSYFGDQCFSHLVKVTAGLDSVILGETEIQRQVKEAYEKAALSSVLPACLHYMFQKSLKIGKEIRNQFSLPKSSVSTEIVVKELIEYFFQKQKDLSILFVGLSEINRKMIGFLEKQGFSDLYLATRNPETAKDLPCQLIHWVTLSNWSKYDIVISGSIVSEPVIRSDHLEGKDSIRTKLVIDLGLPRNVDPSIEKHPFVTLFNIEELNFFLDQKQKGLNKERDLMKKQARSKASYQMQLYEKRQNKVIVCA